MEEGNAIARYLREKTLWSFCLGSLICVKPGCNQRCWGLCSESQSWCSFTAVCDLQGEHWQHLLLTTNLLRSGFHEESLFYLWHLPLVNGLITGIRCPLLEGNSYSQHTQQIHTLKQCCAHCSLRCSKQFLNNRGASFQLDHLSGYI